MCRCVYTGAKLCARSCLPLDKIFIPVVRAVNCWAGIKLQMSLICACVIVLKDTLKAGPKDIFGTKDI